MTLIQYTRHSAAINFPYASRGDSYVQLLGGKEANIFPTQVGVTLNKNRNGPAGKYFPYVSRGDSMLYPVGTVLR